jgi:hypothetical protein
MKSPISNLKSAIAPARPADLVNHPPHYGGDTLYEVIKVIEAWHMSFHLGNVVKYVARAGMKPHVSMVEDLKKARWYLDRYIDRVEHGKV